MKIIRKLDNAKYMRKQSLLSGSGDVSSEGARPDSGMYSYANAGGTAEDWQETVGRKSCT